MEINNRTVRLLSQTNNFTDENLWSFLEENFDLKLQSKQFLLKNKFILLDYNIIKALKNTFLPPSLTFSKDNTVSKLFA